jgi:hypothetical protein
VKPEWAVLRAIGDTTMAIGPFSNRGSAEAWVEKNAIPPERGAQKIVSVHAPDDRSEAPKLKSLFLGTAVWFGVLGAMALLTMSISHLFTAPLDATKVMKIAADNYLDDLDDNITDDKVFPILNERAMERGYIVRRGKFEKLK